MTPGTKNAERGTKNQEQKASRFLFLNQFVPPDPAPTARLLGDVADELRRRGHEIVFVGDRSDYRGGKTLLGSRALREGVSLLRLLARTMFTPRADVIICLTSPPLVAVVAQWSRLFHRRAKLIHWAMDLYPDVAVALGEVRENSLLHRITSALMGSVYRACDLIVVLDAEMSARVGLHGAASEIYPPWPPGTDPDIQTKLIEPARETPVPGKTFTWLYSGNLGRAHEWTTLIDAQHLLEKEGIAVDLVFQGGGTERKAAQHHAGSMGLTRCHWRPYAGEEELVPSLLAADCLIVTQRPETSGCLWPSKLALILLMDKPILWIGATNGGVSRLLREAGHACFAPGEPIAVAETIKTMIQAREIHDEPTAAQTLQDRIKGTRADSIAALASRFEGSVQEPKSPS